MVGLIILREPVIALLFKRGAFDAETTRLTAVALLYYGIGLWAFSAVRIVVSTFYALQDTKTPVRMAVVSVIANIVLGVLLMGPLGPWGTCTFNLTGFNAEPGPFDKGFKGNP